MRKLGCALLLCLAALAALLIIFILTRQPAPVQLYAGEQSAPPADDLFAVAWKVLPLAFLYFGLIYLVLRGAISLMRYWLIEVGGQPVPLHWFITRANAMAVSLASLWNATFKVEYRRARYQQPNSLSNANHLTYNYKGGEALPGGQAALPPGVDVIPKTALQIEAALSNVQRDSLDVCLGNLADGSPVIWNAPRGVHVLNQGQSGGGKSKLYQTAATQLHCSNSNQIFQAAYLDCEGVTSRPFKPLAWIYATDLIEICEAAEYLAFVELPRRRRRLPEDREANFATFLDLGEPFTLVFIEEMLVLTTKLAMLDENNKRANNPSDYLGRFLAAFKVLALDGRKFGVCLWGNKQCDYSNPAIREAQQQFGTRLSTPAMPRQLQAAGFMDTDLINAIWGARGAQIDGKEGGLHLMERGNIHAIIAAPRLEEAQIRPLLTRYAEPAREVLTASYIRNALEKLAVEGEYREVGGETQALQGGEADAATWAAAIEAETIRGVRDGSRQLGWKYSRAQAANQRAAALGYTHFQGRGEVVGDDD